MRVKDEHPLKAETPIEEHDDGISTCVKDEHP